MALEINTTDDGQIQFQGLFEDLQMGPLLLWILEEDQQGELTITIDGVQQVIYFADGYPVGTRGGPAENFLGWLLREKGVINDATYLTSLQKMAEEQQLQGQILLQMGAINEMQLQEALVMQLQRKLIRLFRAFEGEFYFISLPELPVFDIAIGDLDPYTLTAHAVRQEFNHNRLSHCLSVLDGFAFRLDPDSQWKSKIAHLHLEEDEKAALTLLENWNTIEHFVQQRYLDPTPTRMLVALLFSTNLLELDDADNHTRLEYTVDTTAQNYGRRSAQPSSYAHTSSDEGVSISVETAKRPGGPVQEDTGPRKRASVTVHLKEDRIETHSEVPMRSASFEQPYDAFSAGQSNDDATDPALAAVPQATGRGAVIAGPPGGHEPTQQRPVIRAQRPAARASVSAPSTGQSSSNGGLSPEDQEHKESIQKKQKSLEGANFYQILEVPENAQPNDIRKAYYAQSRTFHPDRVSGTPLEPYKEALDIIFSRLNEAYTTLSNPSMREEYDIRLNDPEAAELEERAPKAAQAEVFFGKANVFIKMRDFASAEEQLQWACKLLSDVGDYQVALAWAIYNNPKRGAEDKFQKAVFHLENASDMEHTDKEKMLWYWGCILQKEQEHAGALERFQELVKLNPKHVEAIREIRNLNAVIRREKDQSGGKSGKKGLFGFLKK